MNKSRIDILMDTLNILHILDNKNKIAVLSASLYLGI